MAGADPSSAFLILASLTAVGRKSAGAAAITTASAVAVAATTASRSCSVVSTRTTLDAGRVGQGHVGADEGDVGAPRGGGPGQGVALEARRSGCRGTGPGRGTPGCRRRRRPPCDRPGPGRHRRRGRGARRTSSKISAGSGSRPLPVSAPVRRPSAGSMTTTPRAARRVATLAAVAGCSHISVCIAGAKTTGQRAVSRVLVSRSSASPCAALASRSAVAGATTTTSACLADPDVGHGVDVGPHVGGDGLARQGGPRRGADELQRRGRGHDGDVVPRLGEPAEQLAGLVGRDAAADPQDDLRRRNGHSGRRVRRSRHSVASPAAASAAAASAAGSMSSQVRRSSLISRSAIESGFSWTWVSTSGPTYSSRPSPSWE